MSTQSHNKPAATLRDGAINATIWKNTGEKGSFYSVRITRTWKDPDGNFHDSSDYSGTDLLIVARLASKAYEHIAELRQHERASEGGAR